MRNESGCLFFSISLVHLAVQRPDDAEHFLPASILSDHNAHASAEATKTLPVFCLRCHCVPPGRIDDRFCGSFDGVGDDAIRNITGKQPKPLFKLWNSI
jgi:hypothetical protein